MWFISQREGIPPLSAHTPPRLPFEMRTRRAGPVTPPAGGAGAPPPRAPASASNPRARKKPAASSSDARAAAAAPPATTRRGARGASASAKGYYQVIDGVRYDRRVLDDCRESVNDDGVIDLDEARRIVADVTDGPRRRQKRGVVSSVTDCELDTLRYAHEHFEWTPEADAWVYGELMGEFDRGGERDEKRASEEGKARKGKNAAADGNAQTRAEDEIHRDDEEEEEEEEEDDARALGVDAIEASSSSSSSEKSDSDSDSDSDSNSDSNSDASASDPETFGVGNPSKKTTLPKLPDWDALDDYNASLFAKMIECAALETRLDESPTAADAEFASPSRVAAARRRATRFLAVDMALASEANGGAAAAAARSSSARGGSGVVASDRGGAGDSLFGGHDVGGDLVERAPAPTTGFGGAGGDRSSMFLRALPSEKRSERRAKPSERERKQKPKKSDPDAQGGVSSLRDLAATGAGLFVAPLDPRRMAREARKLDGGARTAGSRWFHLPKAEYTPELRRDLRLLKLRGAYDPKRFYKTDDTTKLPTHFQVGTVVESAADFYGARMTKRERKRSLAEELLADADVKAVRKKRFAKIQEQKAHTMGRKNKRKLGGRRAGGGGGGHGQKSTKRIKR